MAGFSESYWMPFTARNGFVKDPRIITAAEQCHYVSEDGRRVFDSLSGLWCCGYGHNRPEIAEAVAAQLKSLDYSPAFQYGHPKVFELADRIAALAPGDLDHVFFTDSGSEAADTSLKIARAYWRARGQSSKTKFIGRMKGYHGTNFAGTSLGVSAPIEKYSATLPMRIICRIRCERRMHLPVASPRAAKSSPST